MLPFTGVEGPTDLAVDGAGDVYVLDELGRQVLKLAAGSTTYSVLPLDAPSPDNPTFMTSYPAGVAVDSAGDVYVAESHNNRVLKLAVGSTTPAVLPFTDLNEPKGVAVDSGGDVYIADPLPQQPGAEAGGAGPPPRACCRSAISSTLNGVAVDGAGDVYIADSGNNRVLKLAVGATAQACCRSPGSTASGVSRWTAAVTSMSPTGATAGW